MEEYRISGVGITVMGNYITMYHLHKYTEKYSIKELTRHLNLPSFVSSVHAKVNTLQYLDQP